MGAGSGRDAQAASLIERLRSWRELRRLRARDRAEVELRNRRIDDGTIWRTGKGGGHHT